MTLGPQRLASRGGVPRRGQVASRGHLEGTLPRKPRWHSDGIRMVLAWHSHGSTRLAQKVGAAMEVARPHARSDVEKIGPHAVNVACNRTRQWLQRVGEAYDLLAMRNAIRSHEERSEAIRSDQKQEVSKALLLLGFYSKPPCHSTPGTLSS